MILILTAFLAAKTVLPTIDRNALELQARAEALQPRGHVAQPAHRPVIRRASGGTPLDLVQITTICRAAGNQDDPAAFLSRLSSAYALTADDSVALRSSCAAYLAGRADARR